MVGGVSTKTYSIQVSHGLYYDPCLYLISLFMFSIEWHHLCASGSSRTFRVNCLKHVGFVPWFSPHMRAKTINLKSACKSYSICADRILMSSHIVMMCILFLRMARALLSSAQIGMIQLFGRNGFNLELNALEKVSSFIPKYIIVLMQFLQRHLRALHKETAQKQTRLQYQSPLIQTDAPSFSR